MWHLNPTLIPVAVAALGAVKRFTYELLQQSPGTQSLPEI